MPTEPCGDGVKRGPGVADLGDGAQDAEQRDNTEQRAEQLAAQR
ncbi:hypothetical protein [Arthrobacter sp. UYCu723]